MEDNLRMGSNSKKSGAKKKKSSGKSSKSRPPTQPELEEAAPPRIETTSPSKKRKSDEKQIPLEEKLGAEKSMASIDQAVIKAAGKGKKLTSGSLGTPTSREAWERQLRPRKLPKTFQDVRVGEGDATRVIGRRLRVFWPLDDKWYSGLVKSFDGKKKRHHVVYDDGDEEWLELKKERVKILVAPGELFGDKPKEKECEDGTTHINAPKQKESSSSSSGEGKKSGAKRKRHSVVDVVKKNDGRRKKEAQVKEEKQESAQKNKLEEEEEEEETPDGETMEGNAAINKVDSEQVGSVDTHSERNEGLQNKEEIIVNKDSRENENEEEGKNSKKVKSSRRTAPRSKRGASARRTQATSITEHHIEDVHAVKQHRVGHSEAKPDIKLEEGSKAAGNANVEDIIVPEVESIPNDDDDEKKQQKTKESGPLCEQKTDSSVAETDIVGDTDAKGSIKDVTKQAEKLDETATVAEQSEEQQKDDLVKPGNEDEPIRRIADQSSEKHLDVTVGDEKAIEKQGDVKDADQLNKKHNKKHRGKVKPREPVKK